MAVRHACSAAVRPVRVRDGLAGNASSGGSGYARRLPQAVVREGGGQARRVGALQNAAHRVVMHRRRAVQVGRISGALHHLDEIACVIRIRIGLVEAAAVSANITPDQFS